MASNFFAWADSVTDEEARVAESLGRRIVQANLQRELLTSAAASAVYNLAVGVLVEQDEVHREHLDADHKLLKAIWELHSPSAYWSRYPGYCAACGHRCPCPTRRLFDNV